MSWKWGAVLGGLGVGVVTVLTGGAGAALIPLVAGTAAGTAAGVGLGAAAGAGIGAVAGTALEASVAATIGYVLAPPITIGLKEAIICSLAGNFMESFVDNVIRDKATYIPVGAIVYCDLYCVEHSGVYIGENKIAHLDGSGRIEAVSPKTFLDRLGGLNNAMSIYVSCKGDKAVGSEAVASYAKRRLGGSRSYNLATNNCHRFTTECLLCGDEGLIPSVTLKQMKYSAFKAYSASTWRVWDYEA